MQAMVKLDRLRDEVTALELAISIMGDKGCDTYLIGIVEDIKKSKFMFQKELEDALKDTQLTKQF